VSKISFHTANNIKTRNDGPRRPYATLPKK